MKFLSILIASFFLSVSVLSQDSLKHYLGKYVIEQPESPVPDVVVAMTDSILSIQSTVGTSELKNLGVDSFLLVEYNGSAVFKRNDAGKVVAIHIRAMEYFLIGKKEEEGIAWMNNEKKYFNRELNRRSK